MSEKMSRAEVERERNFYNVLQQRKWWRTGDGRAIRRRDMNVQYKLNALAYLMRHAIDIVSAYAMDPCFASAPDDVDAQLDHAMREPERAIMETPMAQALLQDIMSFADIGPEDIGMESVRVDDILSRSTRTLWHRP